jgi:hypothetical protein
MSLRTIAGTTAAVAALAVPTAASARPDYQFDAGAQAPATAPTVAASGGADHNGSGTGTLTVLAVAAGTLLAGAASGFAGGRVTTRRAALRS